MLDEFIKIENKKSSDLIEFIIDQYIYPYYQKNLTNRTLFYIFIMILLGQ